MGSRAQQFFNEFLVGAKAKTQEELIDDMVKGTVQLGANVCDH